MEGRGPWRGYNVGGWGPTHWGTANKGEGFWSYARGCGAVDCRRRSHLARILFPPHTRRAVLQPWYVQPPAWAQLPRAERTNGERGERILPSRYVVDVREWKNSCETSQEVTEKIFITIMIKQDTPLDIRGHLEVKTQRSEVATLWSVRNSFHQRNDTPPLVLIRA